MFFFQDFKSSLDFGPPDDILVMMTSQGSLEKSQEFKGKTQYLRGTLLDMHLS